MHERDLARITGRLSPGLLDRPRRLKAERVAELARRLDAAVLDRNIAMHGRELARTAGRLSPALLDRPRRVNAERLNDLSSRLDAAALRLHAAAEHRARLPELAARMRNCITRRLQRHADQLARLEQLRLSLDPDRPLALGFARVHRADGSLARKGGALQAGEAVSLVFQDATRGAVVEGAATPKPRPTQACSADPRRSVLSLPSKIA